MEKFEIQRALDGVMDVVMEVSNLAISTLTVGEQTFHDASAVDCECFFGGCRPCYWLRVSYSAHRRNSVPARDADEICRDFGPPRCRCRTERVG
jgi:hypothetical protein